MHVLRQMTFAMAAVAAFAGSAAPAEAATAISGSLNITASTILSPTNPNDTSVAVVNNDTTTWTSTPIALSASVLSNSVLGTDTVSAFGSASATWASANSGTVTLSNFGWQFNTTQNYSAAYLGQPDAGPNGIGPLNDWSYTFTANGDGEFVMNYNITGGSTNNFGFPGWGIGCDSCIDSGAPIGNVYDPTSSGTYVAQLIAGQTYTVGLINGANLYVGTPGVPIGPFNASGSQSGEFDWSITEDSVPEPASWALMLGGVGLAGAALRRRSTRLAA